MTDETQPDAQPSAEQLAQDFKKDELQAAAAVVGVDVPSGATKADIAEAIVAQPSARPVIVDNHTRRSGDDALFGHWVDIVGGEFAGRRGHYFQDLSNGPDGFPDRVLVRSRDSRNEVLTVNYSDVRPTEYSGGR